MNTGTLARQRARLVHYGLNPALAGRAFNRAPAPAPAKDPDLDVVIPETPAELEELLNDSEKVRKIFADKDKFGDLISAYAKTVLDKDQAIATQVREEVQRVTAQFLKDNQAEGIKRINLDPSSPVVSPQAHKAGLYNPKAMGAAIDGEFEGSADFFRAIWHHTNRDAKLQAKLQRVRNAFSSTVPSEGGFLIPENLRAELLRVALETSIVRPRARVVPMDTLRVPYPMIDSTSNVSSTHGGIVTFWTEEGAKLTKSAARFGRVVLDAKKLTAYAVVPNELVSDSPISFGAFIDQAFPEAMAFGEDDAFLNGTGVGEPLGFMNGTAAVTVNRTTPNLIKFEDIVAMYPRMLPTSLARGVWIASIDTFAQLAQMVVGAAGTSPAVWLTGGQVIGAPAVTIFGRPVIFTEKSPTLGGVGDLSFVDLGYYLIGDRQVMSAMSSEHANFDTDETAFRFIERVDGRPWIQSAITPKNNGPALSPVVKLGG